MSSILIAFTVAAVLSIHGLRKKSLSKSGASCAFPVGFCMFAGPLRAFGVSLIVFYLIGSRATKCLFCFPTSLQPGHRKLKHPVKVGKQRKAQLEDGHHEAGHRNAWQVLCNSLTASLTCLVWNALFVPGSITSTLASQVHPFEKFPFNEGEWCPLSKGIAHGWSRGLLFAALGLDAKYYNCGSPRLIRSLAGISPAALEILLRRSWESFLSIARSSSPRSRRFLQAQTALCRVLAHSPPFAVVP
jgi:hypothetical protein